MRSQQSHNNARKKFYNYDPYRCQKQVMIDLDGHRLCATHAGQLALAMLLGEDPPFPFGPGESRDKILGK